MGKLLIHSTLGKSLFSLRGKLLSNNGLILKANIINKVGELNVVVCYLLEHASRSIFGNFMNCYLENQIQSKKLVNNSFDVDKARVCVRLNMDQDLRIS